LDRPPINPQPFRIAYVSRIASRIAYVSFRRTKGPPTRAALSYTKLVKGLLKFSLAGEKTWCPAVASAIDATLPVNDVIAIEMPNIKCGKSSKSHHLAESTAIHSPKNGESGRTAPDFGRWEFDPLPEAAL